MKLFLYIVGGISLVATATVVGIGLMLQEKRRQAENESKTAAARAVRHLKVKDVAKSDDLIKDQESNSRPTIDYPESAGGE